MVAQLASELGAHAAFYLPATPNGRAVTEAWAAEGEAGRQRCADEIGVLLISGEEAVSDPQLRALALRAKAVIAITMFSEPARGFADLVLPGTSYLERDGTIVNLEGRPQRLRRAVIPPAPDELAWIAKLAERFGVAIDPHERAVPNEEQAQLPPRAEPPRRCRDRACTPSSRRHGAGGRRCASLRYRSLFSGPGGRAGRGAPVPAPRRGDRALAARRAACAASPPATRSSCVERHLGRSSAPGSTASSSTGASAPPEEHVRGARQGRGGEQDELCTQRALVDRR